MSGAVKRDFRPYIRRYTSLNEYFVYIYPLNNALPDFLVNLFQKANVPSDFRSNQSRFLFHLVFVQPKLAGTISDSRHCTFTPVQPVRLQLS